ncbi:MAG: hypothetical protein P8K66_09425 [Planctomycetota bacterium]|nr:hypothetical protein [Planctomycetota bacterium]
MKLFLTILTVITLTGAAVLVNTLNEASESANSIKMLQNKIQVLEARLTSVEERPEPTSNFLVSDMSDSEAIPSDIPDALVEAIAYKLAQDTASMQAIAREVPRNANAASGEGVAALDLNQFDSKVRDTLESIEQEKREEQMQRWQDRMAERTQERADRIADQLGLQGRTAEDFSTLMIDHSSERMQLMMESRELNLDRGESRNLINSVREEQNEEIAGILTSAQYEQYLEIPQDSWRGGRGGGGGGNNSGGNNSGGNNSGGNNSGGNNSGGNNSGGNNQGGGPAGRF